MRCMLVANDQCRGHPFAMLCHCLPTGSWLHQVLFAHWQLAAPLFAHWQLAGCITACCPQHALNRQCLQQIKQRSTHRGLLTPPTMQLHLPAAPSAARSSPVGYRTRSTGCHAAACGQTWLCVWLMAVPPSFELAPFVSL